MPDTIVRCVTLTQRRGLDQDAISLQLGLGQLACRSSDRLLLSHRGGDESSEALCRQIMDLYHQKFKTQCLVGAACIRIISKSGRFGLNCCAKCSCQRFWIIFSNITPVRTHTKRQNEKYENSLIALLSKDLDCYILDWPTNNNNKKKGRSTTRVC